MTSAYTIACYYFPNYHIDPRNEAVHGSGWTEWELVKRAESRFSGHRQPRTPLWGYEDEANPTLMAKKIDAAANYGLDVFIFDWYWYDDGPFLARGLNNGFLNAPNNHRLKFALMWANHNWLDIHPAKLGGVPRMLYPGAVTPQTFETIIEVVIEHYFKHPSYWLIEGCPYFSIYELYRLVEGLGGVEQTRTALQRFRARVKAAGFPDLHLNAVVWGVSILPGETAIKSPNEFVQTLGFDSITSYVWIHHASLDNFPQTDYDLVRDLYRQYWENVEQEFSLPYFPNVTMGWDSSPRTVQSDVFVNAGYPFMAILANNTPERFRAALSLTRQRLEPRPAGQKILTLNAWNEWTEGSYLEPDTEYGLAYLEAIRDVFGP